MIRLGFFLFLSSKPIQEREGSGVPKTLALSWKIISPPFEMCDLVKITCLGGFYTLNLGNTKEAIFQRLELTGRKTLDSHITISMIPLTSGSLSDHSGKRQSLARMEVDIIAWQALKNQILQ